MGHCTSLRTIGDLVPVGDAYPMSRVDDLISNVGSPQLWT